MTSADAQEVGRQLIDNRRPLIIDALNLAYWCGPPPSLRLPLALFTQLLTEGRTALLYFDASARYQLATEAAIYERLLRFTAYVIEVPSGRTADAVMLRKAKTIDACLISRDRYRDHRKRYRRLIDDPMRLLSGAVSENHLRIPALSMKVPLAQSAEDAWSLLEAELEKQIDKVASSSIIDL